MECQPYHLEAAGCWNKLKNCLVDIDMFGIWWTPNHKKEFVALWASLTNANNQVTDEYVPCSMDSSDTKPSGGWFEPSALLSLEWRRDRTRQRGKKT